MDGQEIGRQLRARRAAAGRTVASVAMDAGLSVPYVANLENGRGNPTLSALSRLATALDTELAVSLDSADPDAGARTRLAAEMPQSLVRFGRTRRFRAAAEMLSRELAIEPDELAAQLLTGLAMVGTWLSRDLAEADCWRLLDALTLIALTPGRDQ
ncbi:MAG TPA: helix-turn-helix domain-containing protein [Streptosporangiaceae bacterium]